MTFCNLQLTVAREAEEKKQLDLPKECKMQMRKLNTMDHHEHDCFIDELQPTASDSNSIVISVPFTTCGPWCILFCRPLKKNQ